MISRTLRFLFPVVLIMGIGLLTYWFWTGKFPETSNINIESGEISQKIKNIVTPADKTSKEKFSLVYINKDKFKVTVVDTPETRQNGLMYKESLPKNQGMLFVFERSEVYGFWMPNVNFPLDIVWIDKSFHVVDIKTVPPCEDKVIQNCPSYKPDGEALYVLEVNANAFPGIIGDTVEVEWNK